VQEDCRCRGAEDDARHAEASGCEVVAVDEAREALT
jgi:hypothetical protein